MHTSHSHISHSHISYAGTNNEDRHNICVLEILFTPYSLINKSYSHSHQILANISPILANINQY